MREMIDSIKGMFFAMPPKLSEIDIFKEHEKFEVGYKADENNKWSMSVYEKATDKIVARMDCGGVVY